MYSRAINIIIIILLLLIAKISSLAFSSALGLSCRNLSRYISALVSRTFLFPIPRCSISLLFPTDTVVYKVINVCVNTWSLRVRCLYVLLYLLLFIMFLHTLSGRGLLPTHQEYCARLTLVRFSSVGRAPTSATEPSMQLDLESGSICRQTSNLSYSRFRQSQLNTFLFGLWDQSAV